MFIHYHFASTYTIIHVQYVQVQQKTLVSCKAAIVRVRLLSSAVSRARIFSTVDNDYYILWMYLSRKMVRGKNMPLNKWLLEALTQTHATRYKTRQW